MGLRRSSLALRIHFCIRPSLFVLVKPKLHQEKIASCFFFNPGQKKLRWLQLSSVAKIPLFSATQRYFHSNGLKEQPQKRTTTRLSVGSAWQLEKNKKKTSGACFARIWAENGTERSYLSPADQVGQKSTQLVQEVKSQNKISILTSDSRNN